MTETKEVLVSIIVLAYNDKPYLQECLASLLDQDFDREKYEVIYADNASTDGSLPFVTEQFPSVRVVAFEKNYGFAEGNNRAAEFARGKYISFQNADTIAHRQWLPELVKAIESDPMVKACHPSGVPLDFGRYNETREPLTRGVMCELTRYGYVDFTENDLSGDWVQTLFIAGGSLLINSSIATKLKYYFDPSYFIYNEDTDLGLRINNLGYKVLYVPSAPCYHQRDPSRRTSFSKKSFRMAYLVTRNRFITFYKNMFGLEFLLSIPLIFLGSIIKLRTLPLSWTKRLIYGAGLIPFTFVTMVLSFFRFPKYAKERAYILNNSQRGKFYLLSQLWRRPPPPRTPLADGVPTD